MTHSSPGHPTRRLMAGAAAAGLLLAACGSGETTATEQATAAETSETSSAETETTATPAATDGATETTEAAQERLPLPAVNVFDVATGNQVSLADLAAEDDRPTLLWFYAPH